MIAWSSSFCPPQVIKAVKGIKALNAYGGWGKTAIPSIFKQEWCCPVGGDVVGRTKISINLK